MPLCDCMPPLAAARRRLCSMPARAGAGACKRVCSRAGGALAGWLAAVLPLNAAAPLPPPRQAIFPVAAIGLKALLGKVRGVNKVTDRTPNAVFAFGVEGLHKVISTKLVK